MNNLKIMVLLVLTISCDDIIEVEDVSQKTVTALAPTNNSVLSTANVTFSWESLKDVSHYRLQISTPTFSEATQIVVDSLVTSTSFLKELTPNDYQWRVRAENSGYTTAFSTQSFLVKSTADIDISEQSVVLLAPADAVSYGTTDTINFSWDSVLFAETYSFQIAIPNFENATEIIKNETTIATTFSVSNLAANSYEWRVRALNPTFQTNYTTQKFTVE